MTTYSLNDQTNNTTYYNYYDNGQLHEEEYYPSEGDYLHGYDQQMLDAVNETYTEEKEEEYVMDASLFQLILDVQSYLTEAPKDSPLLALQYKMYTYLKQRAYDEQNHHSS
ncbi:MAG: hypothetical protein EXX96DRAFT_571029 [Benjaminiella poitrasii]|nr:MAG: hypothetical protein EXX96DRAFT_571029 [Benjaminiella poitrasii]